MASQTVKKVIEINNSLLGTMAGGAAVCDTDPSHYQLAFFPQASTAPKSKYS